jgi:hypothetical protein
LPLQIAHRPPLAPLLFSPSQIAARLVKLLAGGARVHRIRTSIPTMSGASATPLLCQYLRHTRAHLIVSPGHLFAQKIDHSGDSRRSPSPGAAPVASPRCCWMHPTSPITQTKSPWMSAPRPSFPQLREAPDHCRRPPVSHLARKIIGTLARWDWLPSDLYTR